MEPETPVRSRFPCVGRVGSTYSPQSVDMASGHTKPASVPWSNLYLHSERRKKKQQKPIKYVRYATEITSEIQA